MAVWHYQGEGPSSAVEQVSEVVDSAYWLRCSSSFYNARCFKSSSSIYDVCSFIVALQHVFQCILKHLERLYALAPDLFWFFMDYLIYMSFLFWAWWILWCLMGCKTSVLLCFGDVSIQIYGIVSWYWYRLYVKTQIIKRHAEHLHEWQEAKIALRCIPLVWPQKKYKDMKEARW